MAEDNAAAKAKDGSSRKKDDEGLCINIEGRLDRQPNTRNPFPVRLYEMLEACESEGLEDIIGWAPQGKGFHLHNQKRFVDEILPNHFPEMKRYQQFQTQLRKYNFRKLSLGSDAGVFFHQKLEFLWGRPDQCRKIKQVIDNATIKGRSTMLADSKIELKYYNKGGARGNEELDRQSESVSKAKPNNHPQSSTVPSDKSGPTSKAISKREMEHATTAAGKCWRKLVALDRLAGGQPGTQLTLQYASKLLNNFPESESVASLTLSEKGDAAKSLLETLIKEQVHVKEWAIPRVRGKMVQCAKAQHILWGQEPKKPVTEFQHIVQSWEEDPSDENAKRLQRVLCFHEESEHSGWMENTEREYLDEMRLMYFRPDCFRKKKGYVYKLIDSVLTSTLGLVNSKGCQHHGLRLSDKFRFRCQPPVAKGFPPHTYISSHPYLYRPYTFLTNQPQPTATAAQTVPSGTYYTGYPMKPGAGVITGVHGSHENTVQNPALMAAQASAAQGAGLTTQSAVGKQESLPENGSNWGLEDRCNSI